MKKNLFQIIKYKSFWLTWIYQQVNIYISEGMLNKQKLAISEQVLIANLTT